MSNEAFDRFLLKLFDKTADKGEISYFNKYEIGKEIGLLDKSEIDRIVKILHGDGFVSNQIMRLQIQKFELPIRVEKDWKTINFN
ncbi:MAG TPA: hypothetical protein VF220_06070 [Nitrososphaeraceae archaeon]